MLHSLKSNYHKVSTGVQISSANKQSDKVGRKYHWLLRRMNFYSGIGTLKAMLDAQKSLFRNQQTYIQALYEYYVSGLNLKRTAGLLSVDDINKLSQQFK